MAKEKEFKKFEYVFEIATQRRARILMIDGDNIEIEFDDWQKPPFASITADQISRNKTKTPKEAMPVELPSIDEPIASTPALMEPAAGAPERPPAVVDATPTPATAAVDAEPAAEVVAPLYAIGDRAEHRPHGLVTVIGNSDSGVHVRYDVAPEETGDERDIVCAEELQSASPYTDEGAYKHIVNYFSTLFAENNTICLTFIHSTKKTSEGNALVENFPISFKRLVSRGCFVKLMERNAQGWNVYVAQNPLEANAKQRIKEQAGVPRAVFAEVDYNGEANLAIVRALVAKGELPPPSAITRSSRGKYQFNWQINPADFPSLSQVETVNRALVLAAGGDPACTDGLRVFRVPCLRNLKYQQKPVVELIETKEGRFDLADFKIAIGEDKKIAAAKPAADEKEIESVANYIREAEEKVAAKGVMLNLSSLKKWGDNGYLFECTCLWVKEHTDQKDSGTAIIIHKSGAIDYSCRHTHCTQRTWANDARPKLEEIVGTWLRFGDEKNNATLVLPGTGLENAVLEPVQMPSADLPSVPSGVASSSPAMATPAAKAPAAQAPQTDSASVILPVDEESGQDFFSTEPFPECPIFTGSLTDLARAMYPSIPLEFKMWALINQWGIRRSGLDKLVGEEHHQTRFYTAFVVKPHRGKTAAINEARRAFEIIDSLTMVALNQGVKPGRIAPVRTMQSADSGPFLVETFWNHWKKVCEPAFINKNCSDNASKVMLDPDELSAIFETAKVSGNTRNTLFQEYLKLHSGNRTANGTKQTGDQTLDNAHLSILGGATIDTYPSLWVGTGGGKSGLKSRFIEITTNAGPFPAQQIPSDVPKVLKAYDRIVHQLMLPGQNVAITPEGWEIITQWWNSFDNDKDSATRILDFIKQIILVLAVANTPADYVSQPGDILVADVNLVRQAVEFGAYEVLVRERLHLPDSWTWVQSQENMLIVWAKKKARIFSPKTMQQFRSGIHPERLPGGFGSFKNAWMNLIQTGVLKHRNKEDRQATPAYSL